MTLFSRLQSPLQTLAADRICIIKPSALGDVVQTLPILAALRQRFPLAHITWVVNSAYASLIRPISLIDEIIEFPRQHYKSLGLDAARRSLGFLSLLHRQRFDLAIDLQGLLRSGLMTFATGARTRIGLATAREGARFCYNRIVDDRPLEQGAVDRYWKLAEAIGVGAMPKQSPLELSAAERRWAADAISGLPRPIVAINAGSRWATKRWPAEHFAATINQQTSTGSVILVGGPGEEAIAAQVAAACRLPTRDFAGKTSLRELAALLEQADVVLTNDSGPMHLAAAVGTPTVAIFTCTSPLRAGPFGFGHHIAQTNVPCRASYIKTCDRMDCMKELLPPRVAPALADLLIQIDLAPHRNSPDVA